MKDENKLWMVVILSIAAYMCVSEIGEEITDAITRHDAIKAGLVQCDSDKGGMTASSKFFWTKPESCPARTDK